MGTIQGEVDIGDITQQEFGDALMLVLAYVQNKLSGGVHGTMAFALADGSEAEYFHVDIHNVKLCGGAADSSILAGYSANVSKH